MKIQKDNVYAFLNWYVESKLLSPGSDSRAAIAKDELINIAGTDFFLNCWEENTESGCVICVELTRKKGVFGSEAYSKGVLVSNGTRKKLEQEDLWNMGF